MCVSLYVYRCKWRGLGFGANQNESSGGEGQESGVHGGAQGGVTLPAIEGEREVGGHRGCHALGGGERVRDVAKTVRNAPCYVGILGYSNTSTVDDDGRGKQGARGCHAVVGGGRGRNWRDVGMEEEGKACIAGVDAAFPPPGEFEHAAVHGGSAAVREESVGGHTRCRLQV
jgi:hypothetical protein